MGQILIENFDAQTRSFKKIWSFLVFNYYTRTTIEGPPSSQGMTAI